MGATVLGHHGCKLPRLLGKLSPKHSYVVSYAPALCGGHIFVKLCMVQITNCLKESFDL